MLIRLPRLLDSLSSRLPSMRQGKRKRRPQHAAHTQMDRVEKLEPLCLLSGIPATVDLNDVSSSTTSPVFVIDSIAGDTNGDDRIKDTAPKFTGTATLRQNHGGAIGSRTVSILDADNADAVIATKTFATVFSGTYTAREVSFSLTTSMLSAGTHNLKLRLAGGALSGKDVTASFSIVIDTSVPAAPNTPDLDAGSDSGISTDNITNDTSPTFNVSGIEAGAKVELLRNGSVRATINNASSTSVSLTDPSVGNGTFTYTVRQTDDAENVSPLSGGVSVTIDTSTPGAPATPDLQADSDTGVTTNNFTSDTSPTFDIDDTENGATVELLRGVTVVASGVGNGGTLALTDPTAPNGTFNYSTRQRDTAGNQSAASGSLSVTIDSTPPAPPGAPDLDAGSDFGGSNTDNITNTTTPAFSASGIEVGVTVELLRNGTSVDTIASAAATTVNLTDPSAPEGTHTYSVRQTDGGGLNATSGTLQVQIDLTSPGTPGIPDLQAGSDSGRFNNDNITRLISLVFDVASIENGATVELLRDASVVTTLNGAAAGTNPLTDGSSPEGNRVYTARQIDVAGNPSGTTLGLTVTVDVTAPAAPDAPDLSTGSDSAASHTSATDDITNVTAPNFDVSGVEVSATVDLLRDSFVVNTVAPAVGMSVSSISDSAVANGTRSFQLRQTDLAGNISPTSAALAPAFDTVSPVVASLQLTADDNQFPDSVLPVNVTFETSPTIQFNLTEQNFAARSNAVFVELLRVNADSSVTVLQSDTVTFAANGTDGTSTMSALTLDADTAGNGLLTFQVRATDAAGNQSTSDSVQVFLNTPGEDTPNAPGTPVHTSYYDLASILDPAGALSKNQPWQMGFDKTTQTIWINTELGTQTFQFDPATGAVRVYDLLALEPDQPTGTNPHGIFFDFDSYLTPRVWVAHRTAGGANANKAGSVDGARLSYYDLVSNEFVTYEFDEDTVGLHVEDLHAVSVDDTGTIWTVGTHSNTVFEITMDTLDPTNRQASVKAHVLPEELAAGFDEEFVPHGVDVIVDERTGEQYVWLIAEGGSGRIALLRPGFNDDGSNSWVTWDVGPDALDTRGTFLKVDDGETPGIPDDDTIVGTFAVARPTTSGSGNPGGNAGATSGVLYVLDPGSAAMDPDDATSDPATITTFVLPQIPGGPGELAAVNQPYLDREGNIYYIDRVGGIGRLSPDELTPSSVETLTDPARTITTASNAETPVELTPEVFDATPLMRDEIAVPIDQVDATHQTDRSQLAGLDIYEVSGAGNPRISGQGRGPFRGTINAATIIYGSIAQSDAVTSTVLAETSRRQVSVVDSDGGGRMVFQVVRDGSLIMTSRPDGALFDEQINLTRELVLQNGIDSESAAFDAIAFDGDASAVREDDGTVHVFGQNGNNNVVEFRFDPVTGNWTTHEHLTPNGVVLTGELSAFVDGDRGVAAVVTTSDGHLLLFRPDGSSTDLTALAGDADAVNAARVYASVGVVDDVSGGRIYTYGSDMTGSVVEYRFDRTGDVASSIEVEPLVIADGVRPGSQTARDVRILQSVDAVISGGVRHVFGVDGTARMVHLAVTGDASVTVAENVTQLIADTTADNTVATSGANIDTNGDDRVSGYFPFQMPYVARVYTELAPIVNQDGSLSVYGTNGGDLVLMQQTGGEWSGANLSKDIDPSTPNEFTPANFVFGAPDVYVDANGDRHILQINNSGEIVEYTFDTSENQFSTQNINLARGNKVIDLQKVTAPPAPMAGGVDEVIIDNGDAGYSLFGTSDVSTADGFSGDFEVLGGVSGARDGSSIASWEFTGLTAGNYRVSATWSPSANNSTSSVFVVMTGGATASQTRINQQRTPEDFTASGEFWHDLTTSVSVSDGTLTVLLGDDADGRSIADAIRIERILTMGSTVDPLRAEGGAAAVATVGADLQAADLAPIVEQARTIWASIANLDTAQLAILDAITPAIADLSGSTLAGISDSQLFLDINAAGYGWFVDSTPGGSGEFGQEVARNALQAGPTSPAADRVDLLTVVLHEMGHALGYDDLSPADFPNALMSQELGTGTRRLPASETVTIDIDGSSSAVSLSIVGGDLVVTQAGQQIDRVTLAGVSDLIISGSSAADSINGDFTTPGSVGLQSIVLNGNDGNDVFNFAGINTSFATSITINGNAGDDRITSLAGIGYFIGGDGTDVFAQRGSTISISDATFAGITEIATRLDGVSLKASARHSVLDARGLTLLPVTLRGSGGHDTLRGGSQDDVIYGMAGDDLIEAGGGNDKVMAGSGNDNVSGGDGNDSLQGNSGHDTIDGGSGDDRIVGHAGKDKLRGGSGDDTINGGAQNDTIVGESGNDRLLGGRGNDLISGGEGDDNLNGSHGSDTVLGNSGRDILRGGAHADVLIGGDDQDRILGQGSNRDTLVGGNGGDDEPDDDRFDRAAEVDNAFAIDTSILDRLNF